MSFLSSQIVRKLYILAIAIFFSAVSFESAKANWSLNLGYNNPPGSLGVNFLYWSGKIGFEVGIGQVKASAESENTDTSSGGGDTDGNNTLGVGGAISGKYFFSGGGVAPYVQLGVGAGFGVSSDEDGSDAGAGVGGLYGGVGLMFGNPSLYFYGGLISGGNNSSVQAGIGFDI